MNKSKSSLWPYNCILNEHKAVAFVVLLLKSKWNEILVNLSLVTLNSFIWVVHETFAIALGASVLIPSRKPYDYNIGSMLSWYREFGPKRNHAMCMIN